MGSAPVGCFVKGSLHEGKTIGLAHCIFVLAGSGQVMLPEESMVASPSAMGLSNMSTKQLHAHMSVVFAPKYEQARGAWLWLDPGGG